MKAYTNMFVCVSQASTVRDSLGRTPAAGELMPAGFPLVVCLAPVPFLVYAMFYRAVPSGRIQGKGKVDFDGVKSSPDRQSSYEQALDPNTYLELKARPSNHEQSNVPTEYHSLQEIPKNPEYYNMVLHKENGGKQNEEVYKEI